jgi:chromosome segregation ATPase
MSTKIDELSKDIQRLHKAIHWIEEKLEDFDNNKNRDQWEVPKLIKEKTAAEELLRAKRKELEIEENKERTRDDGQEERRKLKEFKRKDRSYAVIHSSYPKLGDN